jgi:hypothetical protein
LRNDEEKAARAARRYPRVPVALSVAFEAVHDEHDRAVRAEAVGAVRPHLELALRSRRIRCEIKHAIANQDFVFGLVS